MIALASRLPSDLWFRPAHNRNRADAVLRAAFDDPIAVSHIDQHVALLVEEAHDLQRLEKQAAPLVENALAIRDFALDLDRADLAARNAGVASVLGYAQGALHPPGLGSADVAGDAVDFGVVKTVDDDLVIRAQEPKLRADGAGGATLGPADDPHAKQNHDQHNSGPENKPKSSHDLPALFWKVGGALVVAFRRPTCIDTNASRAVVMTKSMINQRRGPSPDLPKWVKPQLCKLVDAPPQGPEWLHEIKHDGYRMHARLDRGRVSLLTRTGLNWTHKYPAIAAALSALPAKQAYLDGELCGITRDRKRSFSLIQTDSDSGNADALVFFLFDLLYLDGEVITAAPVTQRKERLRDLLSTIATPLQ
jgi:hypothetical protein